MLRYCFILIIQIKIFSLSISMARKKAIKLKSKEIVCEIKRQLTTIHEQVYTMVSMEKKQEALQLYSNSITDLKLFDNTKK
jgi:hypothetical protein